MEATATCPQCAAKARDGSQRFCEFCGHELPGVARATRPPASDAQVVARLAAVERSAEFERLGAHEPRAPSAGMAATAFFLLFWLVAGSLVSFGFASVSALLALFPLAIMGVGSIALVGRLLALSRRNNAPVERIAAQVVDKRTLVSGGESASTTYFVTLANKHGQRREYAAEAPIYALQCPGDAGMAFVRLDLLVEFRRIDV